MASPEHRVADVTYNLQQIKQLVAQAQQQQCQCLLLPELCISGYTCGDLFFQSLLINKVEQALQELTELSRNFALLLVVGAPVTLMGRLYNCAVAIADGEIIGVVPKRYLPNTQEFYEKRWFTAAPDGGDLGVADVVTIAGQTVPFGDDLLFQSQHQPDCIVGIEICEDGWVANPPSGQMAVVGATLLLNLSASPEVLGKYEYRQQLVRSQSARCLAVYAYASAGAGESSTDLAFSGHSLIAENGQILAESERFAFTSQLLCVDVDLERLQNERRKNSSFADSTIERQYRICQFVGNSDSGFAPLLRQLNRQPFVPAAADERSSRCQEIFALQTTALAKRLRHIGCKSVVIGISGGLDSTLALLVAVQAFDLLKLDRVGIEAVTMPGFGTSERTRGNAEKLIELLGVGSRTICIDAAVRQHFSDIGHDEMQHDITYENCQARERTQILMDIANQINGIVIGTGDLSELALGWCTYNGDHMSMYAVNCGVPKTLVRYLVEWCADSCRSGSSGGSDCSETSAILHDVCATPVSPELLPPDTAGQISQVTEDHVGPYELHDFFLFQVVRNQFAPRKVLFLAQQTFGDAYPNSVLLRWLQVFYRRFFSQQFKRSCLPDGPKVGSVALSPRGDWRMPSDACVQLWLDDLLQLGQDGECGGTDGGAGE